MLRSLRGKVAAVCGFAVVQFIVPLVLIAQAEQSVPSTSLGPSHRTAAEPPAASECSDASFVIL